MCTKHHLWLYFLKTFPFSEAPSGVVIESFEDLKREFMHAD